jgi:hypothetical protein
MWQAKIISTEAIIWLAPNATPVKVRSIFSGVFQGAFNEKV